MPRGFPPKRAFPQGTAEPSSFNATKAFLPAQMDTTPLVSCLDAAPTSPPYAGWPHALTAPPSLITAKAPELLNSFRIPVSAPEQTLPPYVSSPQATTEYVFVMTALRSKAPSAAGEATAKVSWSINSRVPWRSLTPLPGLAFLRYCFKLSAGVERGFSIGPRRTSPAKLLIVTATLPMSASPLITLARTSAKDSAATSSCCHLSLRPCLPYWRASRAPCPRPRFWGPSSAHWRSACSGRA
mmetsp:Transcript_115841/g.327758  ORF Transcript_115841/g.327758 Transcript_115841/m.327758 type:complete len:241 (-) Transcript_115841:69-791(-)